MLNRDLLPFVSGTILAATFVGLVLPSTADAAKPVKPRRSTSVLFHLRPGASDHEMAQLRAIAVKYGFRLDKNILQGKLKRAKGYHWTEGFEEAIAEEMRATNAVTFAAPDYLIAPKAQDSAAGATVTSALPPSQIPNDTNYGNQWHLAKIAAPAAWDLTKGVRTIKVVVCDTGVEASHPDLAANLSLPGYNTVDDSIDIVDKSGHGTSTAGTLGAVGGNAKGVSGVAQQTSIVPIKISNYDDGAAFHSDMADCLVQAIKKGAKVANLSYQALPSDAVQAAASYFRSKGGLTVVASGNLGVDHSADAMTSASVVLVGSTDAVDSISYFSNYGKYLDIVAPGEDIETTMLGSGYGAQSGTSFSTPIVAGAAALIYSLNPALTPVQVENMLQSTVVDLGPAGKDNTFGYGRLNVAKAVQKAKASLATATATPKPIVIDNANVGVQDAASGRTFKGTWCLSSMTGFYGTNSLRSCGATLDTYRFTPNLKAGKYDAYLRWTTHVERSSTVPVTIRHSSGSIVKSVNMEINGSKWNLLGRYTFAAGTAGYVEISDANGEACADAVQFVFIP